MSLQGGRPIDVNTTTLDRAEATATPDVPASDGGGVVDAPAVEAGASSAAPLDETTKEGPKERLLRAPARTVDRVEGFISRLSQKSHFFQRLTSMIWLPYAFRSGIRMKRIDKQTFTAVLPFKRFNRNWYNAMAGAALLANSEIAAGMYVLGVTGGGYSTVCKELNYKFLRPCFGPALYRVRPLGDMEALLESGREFNIELELEIVQQIKKRKAKERRVGRCVCKFYVTPRSLRSTGKAARREGRRRKKKPTASS